ncbi:hypothetical protein RFI_24280, partial [Reticulomyxa filosa]
MKLRWIVGILMQSAELCVGFCCDVGKQIECSNDNDSDGEDDTTLPPQVPLPKIKFNIGDYVKLPRGKAVVNTYGRNDTTRGKKYFEANVYRGHFKRRAFISQVSISLVNPFDPKTSNTPFKLKQFKPDDCTVFVNGVVTGDIVVGAAIVNVLGPLIQLNNNSFAMQKDCNQRNRNWKRQLQFEEKVNPIKNRSRLIKYICSCHLNDRYSIDIELSLFVCTFAKRRLISKIRSIPETIATDESDDKKGNPALNSDCEKK